MGSYKGTKSYVDPEDLETLHLSPSWQEDDVVNQSIAIAPLPNHEVSIILSKLREKQSHAFIQFIFTEPEVDLLIAGLQDAKHRWTLNRVVQ